MAEKVIVIAGPTAVGKTRFAIEVAKAFSGEIVSCDSMQLYRYMDIGSAKPTPAELAEVPHHLVDLIDPREPFSAARYKELALRAIDEILARGNVPVVSGGTGLYLDALMRDLDFSQGGASEELRKDLQALALKDGPEAVHAILQEKDPEAAALIHPHNLKRTIRAIERLSGGEETLRPFADAKKEPGRYEWILVGLTRERSELYDRINARVDALLEAGLIEEVRHLMEMGLAASDISMKGIGYKEIIGYLEGDYDVETAAELVKKNTRHYAKRQLTWYRRYDKIYWLNISDYENDEVAIQELNHWLSEKI